jgi:hypothetical protein
VATIAFAISWGWIMLVVLSPTAAVIAMIVVLVAVGALVVRYGSVLVAADSTGLTAGGLRLPAEFVGETEVLHREDYRRRLGVDADARAHLLTRPYLDRGVLVRVDDPADPTPYWLVSTRRPDALAAALDTHRRPHEGTTRGEEDNEQEVR